MATEQDGQAGSVPLKLLRKTRPDYDASYWRQLRALYEGGKRLLQDPDLMERLFPKHRRELDEVYRERCRRAFYIPYPAEIIDHIVAFLAAEPLEMALGGAEEGEGEAPEFYADFQKNCAARGADPLPFTAMLKEQVRTALKLGRAWTLVDLPAVDPKAFASVAEQEKAGALAAYVVPVEPESVTWWEKDANGRLVWAVIHTVTTPRSDIADPGNVERHRWTVYTREAWRRYETEWRTDEPPSEDVLVPMVAEGTHSFGAVQLVCLELPPGLWAMNKMEGMARAHFNKRAALDWGELQSLLPELYEFLGPESSSNGAVIGAAQENTGRATDQPRGQGWVQVRGKDDEAEFVGPPAEPFEQALKSCNDLRDEMHRVTHQMALSVDNSAAALKRSGDSKAQDKAATAVVLTALGALLREHAEQIFRMVSRGRKDDRLVDRWAAQGMEKFDAVSLNDMVAQNVELEVVDIPSPTFQRLRKYALAKAFLGDSATDENLKAIDDELEQNISDEQVAAQLDAEMADAEARRAAAEAAKAGAGGARPEAGGPGKKAKPPKPPGRMSFSSR